MTDAKFLDLPYDVHLQILDLIPVINDMLSVLKTCRKMYNLESERSVYINILKKVCAQDRIFFPSITPVSTMGISELKSVAMKPYRFLSVLDQSIPGSKLKAVTTRALRLGLNFQEKFTTGIFLVPGGRYLFVFYKDEITLWDLNAAFDNPQLVASITLIFSGYIHRVSTTNDGFGLRVMLTLYSETNVDNVQWDIAQFFIYDVYPLDPSPVFEKIAHLKFAFQNNCLEYSLCGDFLVLQDTTTIRVWDFVEDKSISITCGVGLPLASHYSMPFVKDNVLGTISSDDIYIWKLPELIPGRDMLHQSDEALDLIPDLHLNLHERRGNQDNSLAAPRLVRPAEWYQSVYEALPLTFECMYIPKDHHTRLMCRGTRYDINVKEAPTLATSETTCIPTVTELHYDFFVKMTVYFEPYQLCSSRFVSLTHQPNTYFPSRTDGRERGGRIGIRVNRPPLSHSSLDPGWYDYTLLDSLRQPNFIPSSLCPFSGRVCISDADFKDKWDVLIMEYLNE
ncbi:hypothetical protein BDQ17DRAFT_1542917 [Cyathus striatus]|nr:hypothetical protein BDQ17DRAFT_1542917 [Cyathus striatus]